MIGVICLSNRRKPEYIVAMRQIKINKIRNTLRENASPRHVPARVIQVPDIPYTLNMKKVETAVTNILHGRPVLNRDALVNPESLDFYEGITSEIQKA